MNYHDNILSFTKIGFSYKLNIVPARTTFIIATNEIKIILDHENNVSSYFIYEIRLLPNSLYKILIKYITQIQVTYHENWKVCTYHPIEPTTTTNHNGF